MAKPKTECNIEDDLRVREILESRGMLMKDFAEQIGITRETLTRALKGNPQYNTLKMIADGLGVSVPELFKSCAPAQVKPDVNGYIEIKGEIHPVRNQEQFMAVYEKVDGIVHIPYFEKKDTCASALRGFCLRSVKDGRSGSRMMRFGIGEVFTLSYDAESEKFSLTLCIGDGQLKFRIFDTVEYRKGDTITDREIDEMVQYIINEIQAVYEVRDED